MESPRWNSHQIDSPQMDSSTVDSPCAGAPSLDSPVVSESQDIRPCARYQWTKSSTGLYERDIDEIERFYTSFCRRTEDPDHAAFAITGCVTIETPSQNVQDTLANLEDAFRNAWWTLRNECPALASWIQHDTNSDTWKRFYTPLHGLNGQKRQDDWLSTSFQVVDTALSETEWFDLDPKLYKSSQLFYVRSSSSTVNKSNYHRATIFFRAPHDMIDGHGVSKLLDRLIELATDQFQRPRMPQLDWSQEASRLAAPMRVIANIPTRPSDAQMVRFREKMQNSAAAATGALPLGLLPSAKEGAASRKERASAHLSPEATAVLLEHCKDRGWTMTHAVSAAVTLALKHIQKTTGGSSNMRFYLQSMMSTRYLCEGRARSIQEAASNNHMVAIQGLGVDVTVGSAETSDDFDDIALTMKEYYQEERPRSSDGPEISDLGLAPVLWSALTPQSPPGTVNADSYTNNASVGISSLGDLASAVEPERAPFTLQDVWVTGECSGSAVPLMVGGWGGKLEIGTMFDRAYHERDRIESFLADILSIVQKQACVRTNG
ncbi:uncharacterized protein J7T54_003644 [Emericellopsis cladophorae]|uniref:Uncharacterized protein n=1 Tax=Emericellopsis cladophorae TaxID=2686198 RepID=A0A9Q0BF85_9HYPO|nr:uncharacterized protein J7T54_003644 [Emericellopsis cladophorae]KAI6782631.1 hypothetical protein J7T54_003644 [Emericellopsis cladophorae]